MKSNGILFDADIAKTPEEIQNKIARFKNGYIKATHKIIFLSKKLDTGGGIFIECASLILSSFGMTRSGPFKKGGNEKQLLLSCWNEIGNSLIKINNSILQCGHSRDRLLLELDNNGREELIEEVWVMFKQLLPLCIGKQAYGLVGASKILFAVLPEIVLPIDNSQWLHVFKTVDIGDVIRRMVLDIQRWESDTGEKLNEMDYSRRLTTLPSVYNVMAMAARPN